MVTISVVYNARPNLHWPLTFLVSSPSPSARYTSLTRLLAMSQISGMSLPQDLCAGYFFSIEIFLQIFTWHTPSPPLGLSKYLLSVNSSLITLFHITTPPQPLVLHILFSCFICTLIANWHPVHIIRWPLECSSLKGRDFYVSFIAMSSGTYNSAWYIERAQ